ncbi:hypothetical protein VNO77_02039 [Canavalia gladiata]|uniref:Uncharacterized protein n=1 Tax=Canavalia gladiata TaxID=3824 RepID=A0AAN9MXI6_CANGL
MAGGLVKLLVGGNFILVKETSRASIYVLQGLHGACMDELEWDQVSSRAIGSRSGGPMDAVLVEKVRRRRRGCATQVIPIIVHAQPFGSWVLLNLDPSPDGDPAGRSSLAILKWLVIVPPPNVFPSIISGFKHPVIMSLKICFFLVQISRANSTGSRLGGLGARLNGSRATWELVRTAHSFEPTPWKS